MDFSNDTWIHPLPDHTMTLTQQIDAAYLTYSGSFKKINFLLGMRTERMDRNVEVDASLDNYRLVQFNVFPSAHITRQFKKGRQVQLSYSRRVNRPREWELYPFPMYSDSYFTQSGNPYLRPEFTDSYELNLMQRTKIGFVALEGFYRQTNDAFTRVFDMDTATGYLYFTTQNLGRNYAGGVELSSNLTLAKWWNLYASVNVYNYTVEGDNVNTLGKTSTINSDFMVNSTFKLKKEYRIQLVGFYNSPKVTAQGSQIAMYGANLSINKSFMNRRLILTLSGQNIFNTVKFGLTTETEYLQSEFTHRQEFPIIMLSVSYKINDYRRNQKLDSQQQNFGGGML
jgi:outer membrane receptor protein involved in Fe transport